MQLGAIRGRRGHPFEPGWPEQGSRDRHPPLPRKEPQADVVTALRSRRGEAHALGDSTSSGSANLEGLSIGELTSLEARRLAFAGLGVRIARLPPRPRGGGVAAAPLSSKQVA